MVTNSEKLFKALLPEYEKSTQLVNEISVASKEQSSGVLQVNQALQDFNHLTQNNAAASEEIASTAVELKELSGRIENVLSFFN